MKAAVPQTRLSNAPGSRRGLAYGELRGKTKSGIVQWTAYNYLFFGKRSKARVRSPKGKHVHLSEMWL